MVFCSNCGEEISEKAYFCFKCGVRTKKGMEEGAQIPREWLKDGLSQMGQEAEKSILIAAKEIRKAFKTARENIRESTKKKPIVCSVCGEENQSDSLFCYKCGKKLT